MKSLRRARVQSDLKRYWRISEEKGKTIIAYIDMLATCSKLLPSSNWVTPPLSIVAAIIINIFMY